MIKSEKTRKGIAELLEEDETQTVLEKNLTRENISPYMRKAIYYIDKMLESEVKLALDRYFKHEMWVLVNNEFISLDQKTKETYTKNGTNRYDLGEMWVLIGPDAKLKILREMIQRYNLNAEQQQKIFGRNYYVLVMLTNASLYSTIEKITRLPESKPTESLIDRD